MESIGTQRTALSGKRKAADNRIQDHGKGHNGRSDPQYLRIDFPARSEVLPGQLIDKQIKEFHRCLFRNLLGPEKLQGLGHFIR